MRKLKRKPMTKMELPANFAEEMAAVLDVDAVEVQEFFEIGEDKEGWFYAKKKPKVWLDKVQFKALCSLCREYGGQYVDSEYAWKIPGSYAKTETSPPVSTSLNESVGLRPDNAPEKERAEETESKRESEGVQPSDEYFIAKSVTQVGYLYPILKDANGNVIDGYHRLDIDPEWPVKKVDEVRDPVQLAIARLIANVCRRDVPAEEKTEWLRQIAELTGWAPKQIAANLPVSYQWVMKYLSNEYKEKTWDREPIPQRRIGQEISPQFVPCARCGAATSEAVHLDGKFYCANCAEKIVEEARRGVTAAPEGSFKEEPTTGYPSLPSEPGTASGSEVGLVEEQPRPEEIDTGFEWECPECHQKFQLIHVEYPYGQIKHKFERKKEVES